MSAEQPSSPLIALLALEREVRRASSPDALGFVLVNRTRNLLPYAQAVLLAWTRRDRPIVRYAADVPAVDPNAPFIHWIEQLAARLPNQDKPTVLTATGLPEAAADAAADWAEFAAPQALWLPLPAPDGRPAAGLWLARQAPWSPTELVLAERLAETYGHAWSALHGQRRGMRPGRHRRTAWYLALPALGLAVGWIPVSQSALAPAEIVSSDPFLVTARIDGVVARIHVRPNEPVRAGQALVDLDDTELRAAAEVAAQELAVAQAELRAAQQGAFADPRAGAQITLLKAQVELRTAEHRHAESRLVRARLVAERDGIAVFRSANDWIGRPVATGERILMLADPGRVEIEARLAVSDAVALERGADVRMFLDSDPLTPLHAELRDAAFESEVGADGIAAYRVTAMLTGPPDRVPPRLGLRGTARISGRPVPLALYLFRRPITALRQMLGV